MTVLPLCGIAVSNATCCGKFMAGEWTKTPRIRLEAL
jgi:hypothetical protein